MTALAYVEHYSKNNTDKTSKWFHKELMKLSHSVISPVYFEYKKKKYYFELHIVSEKELNDKEADYVKRVNTMIINSMQKEFSKGVFHKEIPMGLVIYYLVEHLIINEKKVLFFCKKAKKKKSVKEYGKVI
jgi:hypothetical protein